MSKLHTMDSLFDGFQEATNKECLYDALKSTIKYAESITKDGGQIVAIVMSKFSAGILIYGANMDRDFARGCSHEILGSIFTSILNDQAEELIKENEDD